METKYEVQELTGTIVQHWKTIACPEWDENKAKSLLEYNRKNNPGVEFRLVKIEVVKTVEAC